MSMTPRYTHILFDADNTLFDFDKAARGALTMLFADFSIEPIEENYALFNRINQGWWERLERKEVTHPELTVGRMIDFFAAAEIDDDPNKAAKLMVEYLALHSFVYPDAEPLLENLFPYCTMYITTNGLPHVQHSRFDSSPIRRYFAGMFISGEMGVMKPDKAYFDHVLNVIGDVDRSRILVVGDSLSSDMKGGINAGLDTCWYNPRGKISGELKPTYTVSSLAQVKDVVFGEE